jgi:hypothetical protein
MNVNKRRHCKNSAGSEREYLSGKVVDYHPVSILQHVFLGFHRPVYPDADFIL